MQLVRLDQRFQRYGLETFPIPNSTASGPKENESKGAQGEEKRVESAAFAPQQAGIPC